jgi:hypothetical protein
VWSYCDVLRDAAHSLPPPDVLAREIVDAAPK